MKLIFSLILLLTFFSCSSRKNKPSNEDLYSPNFLSKIEQIKETFKKGEISLALQSLNKLSDKTLNPSEQSLKYNLIGVIEFSENKFKEAEKNFLKALETADKDAGIRAQINLNLSSSHFKMHKYEKAYNEFNKIDVQDLSDAEAKKYYNLQLALATHLNKNEEVMSALVNLLHDKMSFAELKGLPHMDKLVEKYNRLTPSERTRFLEKFQDKKVQAVSFLGFQEAMDLIHRGEKEQAKDHLNWLVSHYGTQPEIDVALTNLDQSQVNLADFDSHSIGVILPMTGEKESFGRKAMMGIELGLSQYFKDSKVVIHTKDSQASGVVGATRVQELIDNDKVAVIIGGLFPDEAQEEYLEAKKRGIVFISLSSINLPKESKDKYLIEVSGSIESQVAVLTSDLMAQNFGKRIGIFYPENALGDAYVNEFFRVATSKGFLVTEVQSYKKDTIDFREPVERMLSLKFPKERREELDYLTNVYSNEKSSSIRRVQILNPIVDFDWLFLPAYPNEALQIMPIFNYYDASHVKYFGGPSWRSEILKKNQPKIGSINLVGEDANKFSESFGKKFFEKYQVYPKLIETFSYDSISVAFDLIVDKKIENRNELNSFLDSPKAVKGFTGEWSLIDGIWIKDLVINKIKQGEIEKIN
jgi:ABC-type branched-subunit amino acid transport system substrate-binding protein